VYPSDHRARRGQGTWWRVKARPAPRPRVPGRGPTRRQGRQHGTWAGRNLPPVVIRHNGCPPSRVMRRNRHGASKPRSANPITVPSRGSARCRRRNRRSHSRRQAGLAPAGRRTQATGMAPPRYPTLRARTTPRCPKVVAAMARAHGVPCHQRTTHPSTGAQQVATGSAWRLAPACGGPHHPMHGAVGARSARCAASPWPARDCPRAGHMRGPAPCRSSTGPRRGPGACSEAINGA